MQCPIFLSHFNQMWSFSTDFREVPNIKLHENTSIRSRAHTCGQMEGQTWRIVFQTHSLISNVTEAWEDSGNVEEWHMASALYRGPYVFKVFTDADHIINNYILDTSYSMNCSTILYMFVYWACSHSRTKGLLTLSCPSVRPHYQRGSHWKDFRQI